jgi:PP-loop superfamily ATP-utilizing enzyme
MKPSDPARVLAWFSCGAASAVAAKLAVQKHGSRCEVCYCDTLTYEHSDNRRFMADVERWIGVKVKLLKSEKYADIYDVFERTKYLVGTAGARCTVEMKKVVRMKYARPEDVHVFGFTVDELHRINRFKENNPELLCEWPLVEQRITKSECYRRIKAAGIELPMMYRLGYTNNNCIGCVKGQLGYWNKIRRDFPEVFARMAKLERKLNAAINKTYIKGVRHRVFLDELSPDAGVYAEEPDIECGPQCTLNLETEDEPITDSNNPNQPTQKETV